MAQNTKPNAARPCAHGRDRDRAPDRDRGPDRGHGRDCLCCRRRKRSRPRQRLQAQELRRQKW